MGVGSIGDKPDKIRGDTDDTLIGNLDDFLNVSDRFEGTGDQAQLTIGTTSVEGKAGGSPLTERKAVIFQARSSGIFFGWTSGVTTTTGIACVSGQVFVLPAGENNSIWFIASSAGRLLRFQEVS